jgi:hypothetical protein
MAPNAPATSQNSLNGNSGSGQRASVGRFLANGPAADLEDGEITEDEKSADRSTASTPTPRMAPPTEQPMHETKFPPGVGGSTTPEAAPMPEPARPPTPGLASPRPCRHISFVLYTQC